MNDTFYNLATSVAGWMLFFGFLQGCSQSTYTTDLGIQVTVEFPASDPGPEYVDRVFSAVHAVLGLPGDAAKKLRVVFVGEEFDCNGDENMDTGCYVPNALEIYVVRVSPNPCEMDSLAHEVTHYWEHLTGRPADHEAVWFQDLLPKAQNAIDAGCGFLW